MKKKLVLLFLLCTIAGWWSISLFKSADDEHLVVYEENDLWGVMDARGNVIVSPIYSEITGFSNGYSCVCTDSGVGLIDSSGKLLAPCIFDSVTIPEDGFYVVSHNEENGSLYEFYSIDGTTTGWFFEFAYGFHNGYACVISDGGEYLLDVEGNLHSIAPYHFAWGDGFSEDRLLVEKDGLYGYLDSSLQLAIPCIFTWADASFLNGVAEVEINGERLYIDKYGSIVE